MYISASDISACTFPKITSCVRQNNLIALKKDFRIQMLAGEFGGVDDDIIDFGKRNSYV